MVNGLTDKEKRIIELVAEGASTKIIAYIMNYTQATMETYRIKILRKTGCKNSASLIAWAFRNGVLK